MKDARYFEKNGYMDRSLYGLHDRLRDVAALLSDNAMILDIEGALKKSVVNEKGEKLKKLRRNLASSALDMIALCEALLAKLPEDAVEDARKDVEKRLSGGLEKDVEALLLKVFGIEGE